MNGQTIMKLKLFQKIKIKPVSPSFVSDLKQNLNETFIDYNVYDKDIDEDDDNDNDIDELLNLDLVPPLIDSDKSEIENTVESSNNHTNTTIKLSMIDFDCYNDIDKTIKQLRKFNETIDLILATEDGGFEPIHIYYLALKAPKFWYKIKYDWMKLSDENNDNEKQSKQLEMVDLYSDEGFLLKVPKLIIPNLSGQMLKIIIDAMYNEQVLLDYSLVWKLLQIGQEFNLDFLTNKCLNYLQNNHITLKNCVLLFQVGLKFRHQLANVAYKFLLINIFKVNNFNSN